jgi:KDO2-lipid IV(A) lauroyltransferase
MRCWAIAPLVLLARVLARLPQRWLLNLATLMSILLWPVLARRRQVARTNLALCFPELSADQRRRLLRQNQAATVMGVFELMRAWYAPAPTLSALARIEGLAHLQAALASGRGVLLFTGHFTHTELAVRLLSEALARPVRVVIRRHNVACLEETFERARAQVFGPTLAKKDVRGLLRTLQAGEPVTYSADQNFTYQHAFVPFFGISAATLTSTQDLVRRGDGMMLPFWFYRDTQGSYHLRIEPAWEGWGEASPEQAAAIYMRELEKVVRQHPEQYLWVHRRFKTRPPGEAALYR